MFRKIAFLLSFSLMFSCSSEGNRETAGNETSYDSYRTFVTNFEQDSQSETELRAMQQEPKDSAEWEAMKAEMQQQHKEHRQAVEQHMQQYNPTERKEIEDLEKRFDHAVQTRERQHKEISHRYNLRQQLLGIDVSEDDLSGIAPDEMARTYQRFVNKVAENGKSFENRDWELIEGWWSALNSRYRSLQKDMQPETRSRIEKDQKRYTELRQQFSI
jgi:type IV secretory pathway VirB10-like protein